jgi:hypothetical protein
MDRFGAASSSRGGGSPSFHELAWAGDREAAGSWAGAAARALLAGVFFANPVAGLFSSDGPKAFSQPCTDLHVYELAPAAPPADDIVLRTAERPVELEEDDIGVAAPCASRWHCLARQVDRLEPTRLLLEVAALTPIVAANPTSTHRNGRVLGRRFTTGLCRRSGSRAKRAGSALRDGRHGERGSDEVHGSSSSACDFDGSARTEGKVLQRILQTSTSPAGMFPTGHVRSKRPGSKLSPRSHNRSRKPAPATSPGNRPVPEDRP